MISNKKKEDLRTALYNKISAQMIEPYYGCDPGYCDAVEIAIHRKIKQMLEAERNQMRTTLYTVIDTLIEAIYTYEEMEKDLGI